MALNKELHMHDLVVGDVISGQIALTGLYEYGLSRQILQKAQGGGLFVDVGANLGYFSLLWLGAKAGNRAVAIEASERNQRLLKRNIEANGMLDRVQLLNVAAGDHNGTVRFDTGPAEQTGWGGVVEGSSPSEGVEVEMVRLDAVIEEPIAVLKIDVEGADTLVLRGCEKLLQRKMIQTLFFEQNPVRMERLGILQRNTCRVDCIIPQKCGLSNAAGTALIYFPFEGCGGTSIYSRLPEFMNHSVTSEKIILDTLAKHAGEQCVDVLKIDVEGHEMAVLEGAGKKLSEIGIIQFEFGESQLNSKNSFRDFWDVLKEFRVFRCVVDGLYLIPKYSHWLERYGTSNFIAINKKFF